MRLLLDANLSSKRSAGRSPNEATALDDAQVLERATEQARILATGNVRDFAPLLREWAEADRHHAGCVPIWTLAHHEFGIIRGVGLPPTRT